MLVRHGVGEDVDGQGVRFDRESLKELFILSFSLPTVGDVGVVSSDSDQAAVGFEESAESNLR